MARPDRRHEVGRGERVLPGVWRLRLPLGWPGVPHCNAWALAAGDGIVLVDTGAHQPGSMAHLERALAQVNLRVEHIRLLVCTHGHADHYGQAATIMERSGCELWMHPRLDHVRAAFRDPRSAFDRALEIARQSGVPEEPLHRFSAAYRDRPPGIAEIVAPDRPLRDGAEIFTDLGTWHVFETPGHAPEHLCLYQENRRLLISGDHLLGRVSPYFQLGVTPDPVAEFLHSLDLVQELDARLCLAGHGRTFLDVQAHLDANRTLVLGRLERLAEAVRMRGEITVFEALPHVFGEEVSPYTAARWLNEAIGYFTHLEVQGRVHRIEGTPERWIRAEP